MAIQTSSLSLNSRCLGRSVFLHPAALPGMQCQPPVPCDDGAFVTGIASVFSSVKLIDLAVVFGLLQTVLQTLPKALSPSGFSSSWGAILLPICSWYRSHSLPWMSLQFSPVSFPNLPLKLEDQNCKQHSGHHGFIATWSGLVASSPFLGIKRLAFLSQLSTELTTELTTELSVLWF